MNIMDSRVYNDDGLSFTNRTAVLLYGMGAKELVPKFMEKNISTEVLADLTEEDLQLLGADSNLAKHMHQKLSAMSHQKDRPVITPQRRLDQLSDVLVNGNKQLSLMQAFIIYARLRMKVEHIDSFIERNNNLRSSTALVMAVEAAIAEIKDARLATEELKLFLEGDTRSFRNTFYLAVLSGVGMGTCILLRKYLS